MLTPSEYEDIVDGLLALAVKRDGYDNLITHRLKKYRGKSGHEHEIDVSFELTIAELRFLVLVECKRYKRRVGIDDVMELSYRIRDIGAHKGVIVTTCGFQEGAINVAKSEGIGLLIAARGTMHAYMGACYTEWLYWLNSLLFVLENDQPAMRIMPQRIVVGNHHAYISAIDSVHGGRLVFVLPSDLPEPGVSLFEIQNGKVVTRETHHDGISVVSKYEYRDDYIELIGTAIPRDETGRQTNEASANQEPIA